MTDQEILAFNTMYEKACHKMKGLILLGNYRPTRPGFFRRLRANKAIGYFQQALAIVPGDFACLLLTGKLYQFLCNYRESLHYLEAAMQADPQQSMAPQEASIVAMHLNLVDKAVEYSGKAVQCNPGNLALWGNHALNLLVAGEDAEAKAAIEQALSLDPADAVNQNIRTMIHSVIAGERQRPTAANVFG